MQVILELPAVGVLAISFEEPNTHRCQRQDIDLIYYGNSLVPR